MILLRDFTLFVLPALVAAGGWLYALSLRKQVRPAITRDEVRPAGITGALMGTAYIRRRR